ncbi:MAG: hypothetical protein H6Q33_943 [Deltaproteobacteria bacterium]|nr:hypothetical protein [Deltaproteobacteria bacterium]
MREANVQHGVGRRLPLLGAHRERGRPEARDRAYSFECAALHPSRSAVGELDAIPLALAAEDLDGRPAP